MTGPQTPQLWLNGDPVGARATAPLDLRSGLVARGEGLVETMRADGGRVVWRDAHLDRLVASASELMLENLPGREDLRRWVDRAARAMAGDHAQVRLTAAPGIGLVEVGPVAARPRIPHGVRAITLPGAWLPGNRLAEHKTLALGHGRWARRRARAAGADCALLLDARGRAGEADLANLLLVHGGRVRTAPVDGLLPGLTRSFLLHHAEIEVALPDPREHLEADELILTSAVAGLVAVVEVDGVPVGTGAPGPTAIHLASLLTRGDHPGLRHDAR